MRATFCLSLVCFFVRAPPRCYSPRDLPPSLAVGTVAKLRGWAVLGVHHPRGLYLQHRPIAKKCGVTGPYGIPPHYFSVHRDLWLRNFRNSTLPSGAHVWYKARDGLWWLGKIAHRAPPDASSRTPPDSSPGSSDIIRFLDDPGPIKIDLQPARYTTARNAVSGSWCLQRHGHGSLSRGVLRNSDASRGAPTVPTPPIG